MAKKKTKRKRNPRSIFKNKGVVADQLRYLDPLWVPNAKIGKGCIIGLVGGIMASTGKTFSNVLSQLSDVAADMEDFKIDFNRVPKYWRDDFYVHFR